MLSSSGKSVKLWNTQTFNLIQDLPSNCDVSAVSWSKDGQFLSSLDKMSSEISLYTVGPTSVFCSKVIKIMDQIKCIKFCNTHNRYLAAGGSKDTVLIWDIRSNTKKKSFTLARNDITKISFNISDSHLVVGTGQGEAFLISNTTNLISRATKLFSEKSKVKDIQYSSHSRSLVGACSEHGSVILMDSNTNKILKEFSEAHTAPVSSLAFSPVNELLLITVGYDKKFVSYNVNSKNIVFTQEITAPLTSVCFMDNGLHVVLGALTGEIFIYDLRTLTSPLKTLMAYKGPVLDLKVQPQQKVEESRKNTSTVSSLPTVCGSFILGESEEYFHRILHLIRRECVRNHEAVEQVFSTMVEVRLRRRGTVASKFSGKKSSTVNIVTSSESVEKSSESKIHGNTALSTEISNIVKAPSPELQLLSPVELKSKKEKTVPKSTLLKNFKTPARNHKKESQELCEYDKFGVLSPVDKENESPFCLSANLSRSRANYAIVEGILSPVQTSPLLNKSPNTAITEESFENSAALKADVKNTTPDIVDELLSPIKDEPNHRRRPHSPECKRITSSSLSSRDKIHSENNIRSEKIITPSLDSVKRTVLTDNTSSNVTFVTNEEPRFSLFHMSGEDTSEILQTRGRGIDSSVFPENISRSQVGNTTSNVKPEIVINNYSEPTSAGTVNSTLSDSVTTTTVSSHGPHSDSYIAEVKKDQSELGFTNNINDGFKHDVGNGAERHDKTSNVSAIKVHQAMEIAFPSSSVVPKPESYSDECPNNPKQNFVQNSDVASINLELVRNCVSDALERHQFEMNRRFMHMHYTMLKHFFNMKKEMKKLLKENSINEELLLENERLREEIKKLKCTY